MWRPRPQPSQPFAAAKMLRLVTLVAVVVVIGLGAGLWKLRNTDEKDSPPPPAEMPVVTPQPKERDVEEIFMGDESRREQAASVARAIGGGTQGGSGALANLAAMRADQGHLFSVNDESERVPKLRSDYLSKVRDFNKVGTWSNNEEEAASYCDALIKAHNTKQEVFARNSRRDLTYVHLFEEPAKFRGDVVHIQGRVRLLYRYDPPLTARVAGVKDLYEAWVFDQRYAVNPYCVLLTDLPEGMVASGPVDYEVSFDGYFWKRYRYKSVDTQKANEFRDAPLLIGHTFVFRELPPGAPGGPIDWSGWLLPAFMGVLAVTVVFITALLWWFRREDRIVQRRVTALYGEFVEPTPDPEPPVAAPVHPPHRNRSASTSEPRTSNHNTHGHDKARAVHRALGQGGIDSS